MNEKIKRQTAQENVSANKLLIQAITRYLETEQEREWRAGFEAMGRDPDPDTNTAEPFLPAASEVILADE